ncbi:unnamed protein product [Cyclocybe aegerita]|uniref:F-box domain-containing protein n=1 Tax=Cyclocybe aegerita TaxID=1973307 RepID=A0A8S0XMJ8_CYCAE|nr:unnamed protein product [Cyclocybe aegerita]
MPTSYLHPMNKSKLEFALTRRGLGSSYGYIPIIQEQGVIDVDIRFRDGRMHPSWQDVVGHLEMWPHADLNVAIWRWNDDGRDAETSLLTNSRLVPNYWEYLVNLSGYMHKWRSLRVHATLFSMLAEACIKQQIFPPAPVKLQSLAIQDVGIVKNQDPIALYLRQISEHAPLLHEFHLKDEASYQLPLSHTLMHFRFGHIQDIRIDCSAGALDIYTVMRSTPRLRKAVFTQVSIPAARDLPPITCSALETLKIVAEQHDFCAGLHYNVVWMLLGCLTTPRLRKLRIGFETRRLVKCFHDFLARSRPPLNILELIKVDLAPKDFKLILQACPYVTELALVSLEDKLTFSNELIKALEETVGILPVRSVLLCPNLHTISFNGYGIESFTRLRRMLRHRIEEKSPLQTIRLVCPISRGSTPDENSSGLHPEEIAELKYFITTHRLGLVLMDGDKFEYS